MLLIFQILFSLFCLFVISNVLGRKKDGMLSLRGAAFWSVFWLVAAGFVWWPNATTMIANAFGIGRGSDFVLYSAVAVIFFVLFRLHIKLEAVQRDVTTAVRRDALDEESANR